VKPASTTVTVDELEEEEEASVDELEVVEIEDEALATRLDDVAPKDRVDLLEEGIEPVATTELDEPPAPPLPWVR
jgi:hypothetical protein